LTSNILTFFLQTLSRSQSEPICLGSLASNITSTSLLPHTLHLPALVPKCHPMCYHRSRARHCCMQHVLPCLPVLSRTPRSTNNHPYRRDLIVVVRGTQEAPGGGRARVIPGEEVGQSQGRGAWAEPWAGEGEARTTSGRGGRAVSGGGGG
jgi:hypothetical protein